MPIQDEESKYLVHEMREHFFVPSGQMFSRLDPLISKLDLRHRPLLETFKYNLNSVISTVSMPYSLALASVHQHHFQRFLMAERIRATKILNNPPASPQIRERNAYRIAIERMHEFAESEDGRNALIRGVCDFLLGSLKEAELEPASRELIRQGIILLWSAFEVLFRDTFEGYVNDNPAVVQMLIHDPATRKRFEAEWFSLETLAEHQFNLSGKLGSLLVSQQDLSDLSLVKGVYSVVFGSCSSLIESLNNRELWLICQQRHLFVHRRGIVDQKYLDKTGDTRPIGSPLFVTPTDFDRYVDRILSTGEGLAACLVSQNAASPLGTSDAS